MIKAVMAKVVKPIAVKKTLNDICWELLFDSFPILDEVNRKGYYDISSATINMVRQARLMAKMDKYSDLPILFKVHGLSILAIKNGLYRITREDPFVHMPSLLNKKKYPVKFKEGLVSLDIYKNTKIISESAVLNVAHYNNILDDCFGEHTARTDDGRHRASFSYFLGNTEFNVQSVQVELDGAFEGTKCIHVVEVKTDAKTDVTIRQLLYPKRYLEQKYPGKEVCSWLLDYDDTEKLFNFYKFKENNGSYSFDIDQSKRYILK